MQLLGYILWHPIHAWRNIYAGMLAGWRDCREADKRGQRLPSRPRNRH